MKKPKEHSQIEMLAGAKFLCDPAATRRPDRNLSIRRLASDSGVRILSIDLRSKDKKMRQERVRLVVPVNEKDKGEERRRIEFFRTYRINIALPCPFPG